MFGDTGEESSACGLSLVTLQPLGKTANGSDLVIPFLYSFPPNSMLDHTVLAAKKKYRLQLIVIILKNNLLYNRALDLIQEFRNIKQNNYKSQETFEQHFLRKR